MSNDNLPPLGIFMLGGGSWRSSLKKNTVIINDKLAQFLSSIYLGPLFEDREPKEPVQEYLKFLDPTDPHYKITTTLTLSQLLCDIYPVASNIKMWRFNKEMGEFTATEIKEVFSEEYSAILKSFVEHQERFGEVEGDYQQYRRMDGKKTSSHGMHLQPGEKRKVIYTIWRIPREHSDYLCSAIIRGNTKKCVIDNDDWVTEQGDIYTKLKHTREEIIKHPEMILNSTVKSAGKC
jgi:hypothetical protein